MKILNCMPVDLADYKAQRKKLGKSDSYVDQEIGTVKSMINTAFDNGKVNGDILPGISQVQKIIKEGFKCQRKGFDTCRV